MLFFGLSLAAGVVAVLAVEKMDIECRNPAAPKRARSKRQADASVGFVPGAVFLRQQ